MKRTNKHQTVRLTPQAAAALENLASSGPRQLTKVLERALVEAAEQSPRLSISKEEFDHAGHIYKYLLEIAAAHGTGELKNVPGAGQIGLAAKTAALTIKRIFFEAKGRVEISKQ